MNYYYLSFVKPNGRLAVISFHSLEDRIVKNHFNDVNIKTLKSNSTDQSSRAKMSRKDYSDMKFQMNKTVDLDMDQFNRTVKRPWTPLNKKVIVPSREEIERNARARSAKLRIATKN